MEHARHDDGAALAVSEERAVNVTADASGEEGAMVDGKGVTTVAVRKKRPKRGTDTHRPRSTRKKYEKRGGVWQKESRTTGRPTWYGDFRRFADVGGRVESLEKHYLMPEDGGEIRDEEHAREVYWRAVGLYRQARRAHEEGGAQPPEPTDATSNSGSVTTDGVRFWTPDGVLALLERAPGVPADAVAILRRALSTGGGLSPDDESDLRSESEGGSHADHGPSDYVDTRTFTIHDAIAEHLEDKQAVADLGRVRDSTVYVHKRCLKNVERILGRSTLLSKVNRKSLEAYMKQRREEPGCRTGSTIASSTIRNEMLALSNLFERLIKRRRWPLENAVSQVDLPVSSNREASYMQPQDVAAMLDASAAMDRETAATAEAMEKERRARALWRRGYPRSAEASRLRAEAEAVYPRSKRQDGLHRRFPHTEAYFATLIYTGGRSDEVASLRAEDIDWRRNRVRLRSYENHRLKRDHSVRDVPLWPELARILRRHIKSTGITKGLLFRGVRGGGTNGKVTTFNRLLSMLVEAAGIGRHLTVHSCRHTYATAMLHTYITGEFGQLVQRSAYQVAKLLGHTTSRLVDSTYGHLDWNAPIMETLSFDEWRSLPTTHWGDEDDGLPL